jgi:DNA polymerase-3 subunit epsilon
VKNLTLTRPLVVLDLETTAVDPKTARIVEIGCTKYTPEHTPDSRTRRVNPGIPIPAEATAIHGITDADVADCPRFASVAASLLDFLAGADLAGFNLKRFDLKVLCAEFARCGIEFPLTGRAIIDVCVMFHELHPRNLEAAVKHYLGAPDFAAHSAAGDVSATVEVLDAMLARHGLPRTSADLAAAFANPDAVDLGECFVHRPPDAEIVFMFGKHADKPLAEVAKRDPGYLRWMLDQDFYGDAKALVRSALSTPSKE